MNTNNPNSYQPEHGHKLIITYPTIIFKTVGVKVTKDMLHLIERLSDYDKAKYIKKKVDERVPGDEDGTNVTDIYQAIQAGLAHIQDNGQIELFRNEARQLEIEWNNEQPI